ncbi:RES family NAD+ phosphorylase [Variovorax paradoxus]|nr:RES family NAD+ phosphorylase [Variovorax paradoxus]
MALSPPPANFDKLALKVKEVSATKLKRIGRHDSGEPYFGRWGTSRFDSPDKKYGTCYCGQTLDAAMAETILHDEIPVNGAFPIREEEFEKRFLVTYDEVPSEGALRLADLTGANLKRLGGDNNLSAETPYTVTQKWL